MVAYQGDGVQRPWGRDVLSGDARRVQAAGCATERTPTGVVVNDRETRLHSLLSRAGTCTACRSDALLFHSRSTEATWSRPLFMREPSAQARVVVDGEAPNFDDPFDAAKGYVTLAPETDPSGASSTNC